MVQLDWIARQAARQKRLMALRAVIQEELKRNLPFSEVSIRISLLMIRRNHGKEAEEETRQMFGLSESCAA